MGLKAQKRRDSCDLDPKDEAWLTWIAAKIPDVRRTLWSAMLVYVSNKPNWRMKKKLLSATYAVACLLLQLIL